jgi:hypothetical protein
MLTRPAVLPSPGHPWPATLAAGRWRRARLSSGTVHLDVEAGRATLAVITVGVYGRHRERPKRLSARGTSSPGKVNAGTRPAEVVGTAIAAFVGNPLLPRRGCVKVENPTYWRRDDEREVTAGACFEHRRTSETQSGFTRYVLRHLARSEGFARNVRAPHRSPRSQDSQ